MNVMQYFKSLLRIINMVVCRDSSRVQSLVLYQANQNMGIVNQPSQEVLCCSLTQTFVEDQISIGQTILTLTPLGCTTTIWMGRSDILHYVLFSNSFIWLSLVYTSPPYLFSHFHVGINVIKHSTCLPVHTLLVIQRVPRAYANS